MHFIGNIFVQTDLTAIERAKKKLEFRRTRDKKTLLNFSEVTSYIIMVRHPNFVAPK